MKYKDLHETNRISWNAATLAHNSHKKNQASFLGAGGSTLFPEEKELLGNLKDLSLLHLQCNAGQDTLSMANLGAQVSGVDISDTAIDFARRLSVESGIPATFYRADVYDFLSDKALVPEPFNIVFASYGALCWLSDIELWSKLVSKVLKSNGRLIIVEFHPFAGIFEDDWTLEYPYFGGGEPITWEEGIGDYVAGSGESLAPSGYLEGIANFVNPHPSIEFQWGIGDLITALIKAGLAISSFKEYPYSNGAKLFTGMREGEGGRMYPPAELPSLPLMYSLAATKRAE
jgi:SAM-dependent methyltransferase